VLGGQINLQKGDLGAVNLMRHLKTTLNTDILGNMSSVIVSFLCPLLT
jgi:hypothetical protein